MSPINTDQKTSVTVQQVVIQVQNDGSQSPRKKILEKWYRKVDSYSENSKKEREHYRNIEQTGTFLHFLCDTKGSRCSMFPVRSADLRQTLKYYLAPVVFNFYFYLRVLDYFHEVHTVNANLLSVSFSRSYGQFSLQGLYIRGEKPCPHTLLKNWFGKACRFKEWTACHNCKGAFGFHYTSPSI